MARERQTTPIVAPTAASAELGLALEDAGGPSGFGSQKQASVKFGSSSTFHNSEIIQARTAQGILGSQWQDIVQCFGDVIHISLDPSGGKPESPAQSLAAVVDVLVDVNEDQFRTSLTEKDRQRLVVAIGKLRDIIGTERKHFLIPLIDFIDNLIENREEEPGMETRKLRRPKRSRRTEGHPRFKLADLLQETANAADNQTLNTALKPHRSEKDDHSVVTRQRPETDDDAYGEVDTGGPVGYEAW